MTKQPKNEYSVSSIQREGLYNARYVSVEVADWTGQLGKDIAELLLKALKEGRFDERLDVLRVSYKVRVLTKTYTEEMPLHLQLAYAVLSESGELDRIENVQEFFASEPIKMDVMEITVTVKEKLFGWL